MWLQQTGASAYDGIETRVVFAESYGPAESLIQSAIPECHLPVTYVRPCGHEDKNVPCASAFKYASGDLTSPECCEMVQFPCPFCGHSITNQCWVAEYFKSFQLWDVDGAPYKDTRGNTCIKEQAIRNTSFPSFDPKIEKLLPELCKEELNVSRICHTDHSTKVACRNLVDVLKKTKKIKLCREKVCRLLACRHNCMVDCHTKNMEPPPIW